MSRFGRLLAVGATTCALFALATPPPAPASEAGFFGESGSFFYAAGPGEANEVTFAGGQRNAALRLVDTGAVITPRSGCVAASAHEVRCSSPFQGFLANMQLHDGDDRADVQSLFVTVDAGAGNDAIRTNASAVYGFDGNDVLTGTGTRDPKAVSGHSAYLLLGHAGADTLAAGPGSYDLNGGTGPDLVNGGAGDDDIAAIDGATDRIGCGGGFDYVNADTVDEVASDCERVTRRGPAAPASPAARRAARAGLLLVSERPLRSREVFIEGAINFLTVRRRSDRRLAYSQRSFRPISSRVSLAPGRYRVTTYVRPCSGNCGYLDPPQDRCTRAIRIRREVRTRLVILRRPGYCRIVRR